MSQTSLALATTTSKRGLRTLGSPSTQTCDSTSSRRVLPALRYRVETGAEASFRAVIPSAQTSSAVSPSIDTMSDGASAGSATSCTVPAQGSDSAGGSAWPCSPARVDVGASVAERDSAGEGRSAAAAGTGPAGLAAPLSPYCPPQAASRPASSHDGPARSARLADGRCLDAHRALPCSGPSCVEHRGFRPLGLGHLGPPLHGAMAEAWPQ